MSSETEPLVPHAQDKEERDEMGLKPESDKIPTEAAEIKKYMMMVLLIVPVLGQAFAWATYFGCAKWLGQQELYDRKFGLIREFQLGFVYLAVWIIGMARALLVSNANGARAPARVMRPDQHVYKVMASEGQYKEAPFVLMAEEGPQGRFNRAQRGVFNFDESLPFLLVNIILAGFVFGPVVAGLALFVGCARVLLGFKYKESTQDRVGGFMLAVIGEKWLEGLVLLCAIKGIFVF